MAPARTSTRRNQNSQPATTRPAVPDNDNEVVNPDLFLEPMMGTPLAMYIEKDVQDRDSLVDIITVSTAHSIVLVLDATLWHVVLVDRLFASSMSLF